MSLNDNFCSSPWFHLRISPEGNYLPCRWSPIGTSSSIHNVSNTTLSGYLKSTTMSNIRKDMINGKSPDICQKCQYEQKQGKVSGRQRQLLKSIVVESEFNKTLCASPHWDDFEYSYNHNGQTKNTPCDLQIDLGNTCNSACIMCPPRYSSRGTEEHKKLHQIQPVLFADAPRIKNWTDNKTLVDKFVNELVDLPSIKYIHFLGGETLYMKSFYNICDQMIDKGLAKDTIMGTTTNCTVYDDRIEHIIENFKTVHLGLSIESVTDLNDYIRWPSKIDKVLDYVNKFLELRKHHNLFISLRITPTIFSVYHLDQLLEFMIKNRITAESCDILTEPRQLRMELLPTEIRKEVIGKLNRLVDRYNLQRSENIIINRRVPETVDSVIGEVVFEYVDFLTNYKEPDDIEESRNELIKYIHAYESIHNNKILDYLPEYEEFLRSYGY